MKCIEQNFVFYILSDDFVLLAILIIASEFASVCILP